MDWVTVCLTPKVEHLENFLSFSFMIIGFVMDNILLISRDMAMLMHNCVSGPTYYASVVEAAINIVETSGGKFHTLFIITDFQVEFKYFCFPLLSPLFLSHAVCAETILIRVISFCFEGFKWH